MEVAGSQKQSTEALIIKKKNKHLDARSWFIVVVRLENPYYISM